MSRELRRLVAAGMLLTLALSVPYVVGSISTASTLLHGLSRSWV